MQQSILRAGYEVAYNSGFIMSGKALRHIIKCYEGSFSQPNESLAATILKMVQWVSTMVTWRRQYRCLLSEIGGECIRCHCAPRPGVHGPTSVQSSANPDKLRLTCSLCWSFSDPAKLQNSLAPELSTGSFLQSTQPFLPLRPLMLQHTAC